MSNMQRAEVVGGLEAIMETPECLEVEIDGRRANLEDCTYRRLLAAVDTWRIVGRLSDETFCELQVSGPHAKGSATLFTD